MACCDTETRCSFGASIESSKLTKENLAPAIGLSNADLEFGTFDRLRNLLDRERDDRPLTRPDLDSLLATEGSMGRAGNERIRAWREFERASTGGLELEPGAHQQLFAFATVEF